MDSFSLVIFLLLIMIALSQSQFIIAAGLMLVLVFTLRHIGLGIIVIIGIILGFMLNTQTQVLWLLSAVLLIAVLMLKKGGIGPESYAPDLFGGGY